MARILADCGKHASIKRNFSRAFYYLLENIFMAPSASHRPLPDLWQFSLIIYAQPGVEDICLRLQNQWHANVNLLLWLCWLEGRQIPVNREQLVDAQNQIHAWHKDVVIPLRALREEIKARLHGLHSSLTKSYETIKGIELAAERIELEYLEPLPARSQITALTAAGANLQLYLAELMIPEKIIGESMAVLLSAMGTALLFHA